MEKTNKNSTVMLILHNIRSIHNVGSIFRTADALGISEIYLTGYTPTPIDRFGRARKDLAKVALGGEKSVLWEHIPKAETALEKIKKEGFYIVAIEQDSQSVDYKKVKIPKNKKVAFIFGNEVDGIPKNFLEKVDVVAEIPMAGKKESLNVSVSLGVALFRILNL